MVKVTIDDSVHDARSNQRQIDLLNRIGTKLVQVCYHRQLGPIHWEIGKRTRTDDARRGIETAVALLVSSERYLTRNRGKTVVE